jgi:peptidyl-tRNA hydrolase, PTH1 family
MWIIVGLGNPGARYAKTRHNVGFMVLDRIADDHGLVFREKDYYAVVKGTLDGGRATLVKPLTFMNLSGRAVKAVMRTQKSDDSETGLIVVHDDLDLDTGTIKIKRNGSSGGHRGIGSIIDELGTRDFIRIKIGIGRDPEITAEDYVLRTFRPTEKATIKDAITRSAEAVYDIINSGVETVMNRINRRSSSAVPQ